MTTRSICIATPDIFGPIRNGGIGSACFEIAKVWRGKGHKVTILYANDGYRETPSDLWLRIYADLGITFVMCPTAPQMGVRPALQRPWNVWQWLRTQQFDVAYFPEWRAAGLYAIQAKRAGLDFHTTKMIVGAHSPTNWHSTGSQHFPISIDEVMLDSAERQAVAFADMVISPSRYMLDYMRQQNWILPQDVRVIPNPFSSRPIGAARDRLAPIDELVFFGRLERRKGLMIFVKALSQIPDEIRTRLKVTFLGKPGDSAELTLSFISENCMSGFRSWTILSEYDSHQALTYLQVPGRLAVIPSLVENSPMTVRECIALDIPFIAANIGGIPELIAEDAREAVLFEPTPSHLAAAIARVVRHGAVRVRSAFADEAVAADWCAAVSDVPAPPASTGENTRVSVVVTTFNRPSCLAEAIQGLRQQTWRSLEVVLVDDGSTTPEAIAYLDSLEKEFCTAGWKLIRQENRYLGAARNAGWRAATGDLVIFHDDDNYSPPDLVETYVRAILNSGADIATCTMAPYRGQRPEGPSRQTQRVWNFIGNGTGAGLYLNCFGDAHACFRRSALEATGGFTEDYGIGHEDWEIFARASLMGLTIINVPEPLFWYRESDNAMLRGRTFADADFMRSLRPYLDAVAGPLRPALQFALAQSLRGENAVEVHTSHSAEALCLSVLPPNLRSEHALRYASARPLSWFAALGSGRFSLREAAALRRLARIGADRSRTMDLFALASAALPRQMRSREKIMDIASFRQSWQRIAFRHPGRVSYWLAARRVQRAARKRLWG